MDKNKDTVSEPLAIYTPQSELFTISEAALWATDYLGKNVTTSNISYLIQYGKVEKISDNGNTQIRKKDLLKYYKSFHGKREIEWKDKLGDDLNWALSRLII